MKSLLLPVFTLFCGVSAASAAISFTAVRDYDAATNANAVDNNATTLTAGSFTTSVGNAYDNGAGGVINFDNGTGGTTGNWSVAYGAGKSLEVAVSNSSASINMDAVSGIKATPISGQTYYRLGGNSGARTLNTFTFGTGNYLSSFGFTFLARNTDLSGIQINGTYVDGGGSFTLFGTSSQLSVSANTPTATNYLDSPSSGADRFVGFTAPDGKAIGSITISVAGNSYPVIDDFGFVVSPIPEPSGALLLTLSAAGLAFRRRRL